MKLDTRCVFMVSIVYRTRSLCATIEQSPEPEYDSSFVFLNNLTNQTFKKKISQHCFFLSSWYLQFSRLLFSSQFSGAKLLVMHLEMDPNQYHANRPDLFYRKFHIAWMWYVAEIFWLLWRCGGQHVHFINILLSDV